MANTPKTYFCFNDQNTQLDHLILLKCTQEDWDDFYEEEIESYPGFMEQLEELAVHDAVDSTDKNGNNLCGFTSYEVENPETLDKILAIWKSELLRKGWIETTDKFVSVKQQ